MAERVCGATGRIKILGEAAPRYVLSPAVNTRMDDPVECVVVSTSKNEDSVLTQSLVWHKSASEEERKLC